MTDGFATYSDGGKLQVSSEMLTYALRVSGTTYVENRKVGNTCPTSFLVPTSNSYPNALIAIGGGNGYAAAFAGLYGTGSPPYPKVYGTNGAPAGTPFQYYIYERSNTIPASGFGLEVRNVSNEVTFSSNQRVMRVVDYMSSIVNNGEEARTFGGKQLAWCQGQVSGHRISGTKMYYGGGGGGGPSLPMPDQDAPSGNYYSAWDNNGKLYGAYSANGGQSVCSRMVSWDDVRIGPAPDSDQPPDWFIPLNLFVVDVTGVPVGQTFY